MQKGHTFNLWTYDAIDNVPDGVVVRDANEVIPQSRVFRYSNRMKEGHGKGSFAGFSDLFRYRLLFLHGGIYVDMDITCLKAFDFDESYVFRFHHKFGCVGNILKAPQGSEVMDWCYREAIEKVNADNTDWSLPIRILHQGMEKYGLNSMIKDISNPDSWPVVAPMLQQRISIPDNWYAIHWMNEEWRRLGLAKDAILPKSTLFDMLNNESIEFGTLKGMSSWNAKWKLSRWNYMLINGLVRIGF